MTLPIVPVLIVQLAEKGPDPPGHPTNDLVECASEVRMPFDLCPPEEMVQIADDGTDLGQGNLDRIREVLSPAASHCELPSLDDASGADGTQSDRSTPAFIHRSEMCQQERVSALW
jgi:hypothetical protein